MKSKLIPSFCETCMMRPIARSPHGDRRAAWVHAGGVLFLLLVLGGTMPARSAFSQEPDQPGCASEPGQRAEDADDDRLPAFAVARLGTHRLRPGGNVVDLAFSPDGKTLATIGDGPGRRLLQLWNVSDGRWVDGLSTFEWGIPTYPRNLSFAPDSSAVALACSSEVVLWDLKSDEIHRLWADKNRGVYGMDFSADAKLLAWATAVEGKSDPKILLYNVATRKQVREFAMRSAATSLHFSPKGGVIATTDRNKVVDVWDVSTGTQLRSIGGRGIRRIAFSPDGTKLAGCGKKGRIRVWDIATGKKTLAIATPDAEIWEITDLEFTPSGNSLAAIFLYDTHDEQDMWKLSSWEEPNFFVWDATTGKLATKLRTPYEDTSFAFAPDGKLIATADGGGSITLRHFPDNKDLLDLPGHTATVALVAYLPGGKLLASYGGDGEVFVWDVSTGKPIWKLPGRNCVTAMAVSPSSSVLAIGVWGEGVEIWNVAEKKREKTLKAGKRELPQKLAFSPDGSYVASGDALGRVLIWDVQTGQISRKWDAVATGESGDIHSLTWSPDGKTLVVADGYRLRWLDVETGRLLRKTMESKKYALRSAVFSPNGKMLAAREGGSCVLQDATDGREIMKIDGDLINTFAFSPDSTILAIKGGCYNPIRLIDVSTGKVRASVLSGGGGIGMMLPEGMAFSPDGRFLASGAADTTILVWNVQQMLSSP